MKHENNNEKVQNLNKKDISGLKSLIREIRESIDYVEKNHSNLKKLDLIKKFIGPIGEAKGIVKIFEIFGDSYDYAWYGGRKKNYDIVLTKNGKLIKIQIKASAHENHAFRPLTVHLDNRDKIVKQIKNKKFCKIFSYVDKEIKDKKVDYWLFVHVKQNGDDFYMLNNQGLKKVVKGHYKNYIKNHPHENVTHYGINKDNSWNPILHGDWKGDTDLLKKNDLLKRKLLIRK